MESHILTLKFFPFCFSHRLQQLSCVKNVLFAQ